MEEGFYRFKYCFESSALPLDSEDFLVCVEVAIYYDDDVDLPSVLVGKVALKLAYVEHAQQAHQHLMDVFDSDGEIYSSALAFFDFDGGFIKESIVEYYDDELFSPNICILDRIEILPEHRGRSLAGRVIKDIVFHFSTLFGLYVIHVYPLQFESARSPLDAWQKSLALNQLTQDEVLAFQNLKNYYMSLGFDAIPGFENLLFYNPLLRNDRMDALASQV